MPNPWFHFKQFTIYHDKCAMKIGTDGVMLGAWANVEHKKNILDAGTGTGVIAIMLAQRSNAMIDAVEIDENACMQAKDNIACSPWHQRINLVNSSFQDYAKTCDKKYDLVISNPPFFKTQYRPSERLRSLARHDDSLSLADLISIASSLLTSCGNISVIIPVESFTYCKTCIEKECLYINRILNVKPTPYKDVKRILVEAGKHKEIFDEKFIAIETGTRHNYTPQYRQLTRDFYLAF